MKHRKLKLATAALAALALTATTCSSNSDDSSDTTPATEASSPDTVSSANPTTAAPTTSSEPDQLDITDPDSVVPPAPRTDDLSEGTATPPSTTTDATPATTTASSVPAEEPETPDTSEPPGTTTTSTSTTASPPTTTSTTTTTTASVVESPAVLRVRVLNGSGVAGAAGRLTERLSEAGYAVLPASNAPQRYASSAVYYAEGWEDEAVEILETVDIGEIDGVTAMPQQFASEDAAVVVLLGTDTAPAIAREQAGLRPRPNFDVKLPLGDDVPRDRFVPGLANVQIFTEATDNDEYLFALAHTLQGWLRFLGNHANDYIFGVIPEERGTREQVLEAYRTIESILSDFGFTPQNTCGAPAGYSFTDLLQPTREWNESTRTYSGDAIFTTDRLIELHGGQRINPEENLDFYIREAVQTAHDALRITELAAETEAMQLILCRAFLAPSGEVPELANSLWYANLTPGIQPRESLLSQGTYHLKEISRNGNIVFLFVCHPTIGERGIVLYWRESGYRAEAVNNLQNMGCQASFEDWAHGDLENGDTIRFSFGERVFSAGDLQQFPRSAN